MRNLILLVLLSTLLSATTYQSVHQRLDAYGNIGIVNQADKMLELSKTSFPGQYSTSTYEFYLSENLSATEKLEDGSMCTNENFHNFKIYIPVGTQYFALSFGGIGNPGYVINYSYKPTKIDHANMIPDWLGDNQEKIFRGGGQFTGYTASRDGTKSIVSPKDSPFMESGGWLYIDVIRGNGFSPSNRDSGNQMKKYLVKFTLDLKIGNEAKFTEWLNSAKEDYESKTYKVVQPNGDPYDASSSIDIIAKSCTKGILTEKMVVSKGLYEQAAVNEGYSSSSVTYTPVTSSSASSVSSTAATTTANTAEQQCIQSGGLWIAEAKLCDKSSITSGSTSSTTVSYVPSAEQSSCEDSGGIWLDEQSICDRSVSQASSTTTIPTSSDDSEKKSQCLASGGTWIAEASLCNSATSYSSSSYSSSYASSSTTTTTSTTATQQAACQQNGGTWLDEAKICLSTGSSSSTFAQNITSSSSSSQSSSIIINNDSMNTVISKLVGKAFEIKGLFINYSINNEVNKWVFISPDKEIIAKVSEEQVSSTDISWDIIQTSAIQTFSNIEIDEDLRSVTFGDIENYNNENIDSVAYDLVSEKKYVNGYFIQYGDGYFDWIYINNAFDFIAKFEGIDQANNKLKWTMLQNPLTGLVSFDSVRLTKDKLHIRFEALK